MWAWIWRSWYMLYIHTSTDTSIVLHIWEWASGVSNKLTKVKVLLHNSISKLLVLVCSIICLVFGMHTVVAFGTNAHAPPIDLPNQSTPIYLLNQALLDPKASNRKIIHSFLVITKNFSKKSKENELSIEKYLFIDNNDK